MSDPLLGCGELLLDVVLQVGEPAVVHFFSSVQTQTYAQNEK